MSTESNESYLVGDGPELFEIRTVRIENRQVIDPYGGEPLEAPRFLLNEVCLLYTSPSPRD